MDRQVKELPGKTGDYHILVMDGQGGGIGVRLIRQLAGALPENCRLLCVGTNSMATASMLRAGAATGENAACVQAARADLILGPVGIVLADGILGEVTARMAQAVSSSEAIKILIPSSSCGVRIAGAEDCKLEDALGRAVRLALEEIARAAST